MSLALTSSGLIDDRGDRSPDVATPPLDGCPPEYFWHVAQRAGVSLAVVFAIAGGHELADAGGKVRRVHEEAAAIAIWRKSGGPC